MAENELAPPVSGIAWDGTGLGTDGTVWGGEFLAIRPFSFERVGHLRTFLLPGGESAVREPRRVALALLYELFSDNVLEMNHLTPIRAFSPEELRVLGKQLGRRVNAPVTSSIGRLFDAAASLLGLRQITAFEGQAAMELEFVATGVDTDDAYPFDVDVSDSGFIIDWGPLVRGIITDISRSVDVGLAAARFHNTLVDVIVEAAERMNEERVVLTGGCFQNKYLTEKAVTRLGTAHLRPYWHQRVPPNDGGISLGQVAAAVYLRG
jgi:hydrogenase maturation protein HypF